MARDGSRICWWQYAYGWSYKHATSEGRITSRGVRVCFLEILV